MQSKEILQGLIEDHVEFDVGLYHVENRTEEDLVGLGMDFLDAYGHDLAKIEKRVKDGTDIYQEIADDVSERADGMVDIYNYDLRDKAKDYSDFIEESIDEYGADGIKDGGLEKLFMQGQYMYYSRLGYDIVSAVEKIAENWDELFPEKK